MPIKSFRPYTPSRRTITVSDYSDITKTTPEKRLTKGLRKTGGSLGAISCGIGTEP